MSILLYNKVDQNQITRRIDMSTTNIIAKITEIFDTNIEFGRCKDFVGKNYRLSL